MIAQEEIDQARPVGEVVTFNSISVMSEVDDAVSASSTRVPIQQQTNSGGLQLGI